MQPSLINLLRRNRAIAWAALAALVLLQAGMAAHETQHAIGDVAEVCDICVQLDQGDAVAADGSDGARMVAHGTADPIGSEQTALRRPAMDLPARAPPFI